MLLWLLAKFPSPIVTTAASLGSGLGSLDREGWGVSVLSHTRDWLEITTTIPTSRYQIIKDNQPAGQGQGLGPAQLWLFMIIYHRSSR